MSYDDSVVHVERFFEESGYDYDVVMDVRMGGATGKPYQVGGIPTLFLIDREGKIVERFVGFGPGDEEKLDRHVSRFVHGAG